MNRKLQLKLSMLFLFIMSLSFAQAQDKTVSGTVTSTEDNSPLPGVSVLIKGTATGTVTDLDGNYRLTVSESSTVLVFSYIGFISQEVNIAGRSTVNLALAPDTEVLDEVVIQAYGANSSKLNVQQVSSIKSDSFSDMPILSPQEALQGQAAGVQINGSSGLLGASQVVRIRGATSINAGNQPLFVIDGVPLNDGSSGGYSTTAGATALNPLFDLNPNDIENVTVLKDASATALYGSRGGNGVILIQTKKGTSNEKTQFSLSYNTSWNTATVLKDPLNLEQWTEIQTGLGRDPAGLPTEEFDWLDAVTKTGRTSNYNFSARGGSGKTVFYFGGSYNNTDSYVIGNELDKLNARFNLEHTANDKLKFGYNIAISRIDNERISAENSTFSPLTVGYLNTPGTIPFDDDGNLLPVGFGRNPLLRVSEGQFNFISRRNTGNAYAQFTPIEGLTLKTDWGMDMVQTETETRQTQALSPGGSARKLIIQDNKWLTTNTANYSKSFGNHSFSALAGMSFETARRELTDVQTAGFISDALPNTTSGADILVGLDNATEWALFSLFGRVNYNYSDRYIVEASIRRDGSSRFGANQRFGTFWAVSGGWLISEENFFPENDVLTFAKLTASFGSSGNDRIGNFASLGLLAAGQDYNGSPGLEASQPSNPELTWETTEQLNVALNTQFFKGRIGVDVAWWRKNTTGLLLASPLPVTTGFASRTANVGELYNTGIDLTINADAVNQGDFKWQISANLGTLKNEVTSLPDAAVDDFGNNFVPLTGFSTARAVVGRSAQEFFLPEYIGINPETGDPEWVGEDGNPTSNLNAAPRAYVGTSLPDVTGGLTNTFSYKGLSLRVLFNFAFGSKAYIADNEFNENINSSIAFNNVTTVMNYWKQPGDNAYAPSLTSPSLSLWDNESDRHLYDASFIRLRNITLSYNLPKSIIEKTKALNNVRVYLSGQNLATFASDLYDIGIDPEVNSSGTESGTAQGDSFFTSPQQKSFTLGLQIGF